MTAMDDATMKMLLEEIRGLRQEMSQHNESIMRAVDLLEFRVRKLENWRAGIVTVAAAGAFIATIIAQLIRG